MRYLLLGLILTCVISCSSNEKEVIFDQNGYWQQVGYGKIIELQDSIIRIYDICKVDCHLSFEEAILDFGKVKRVTEDSLVIKHGIDDWRFLRIDKLPELCSTTDEASNANPIYNFETFWHTFKEHYCSFELKEIDWEEMYQAYLAKITEETSDLELYLILEEMIERLEDGHVEMELPDHIAEAYAETKDSEKSAYGKIEEFEISKQLANIYVDSLRNYNGGMFRWGMINADIGYIQMNMMLMLANYNIDPEFDLRAFWAPYWERAGQVNDEPQRQEEVDGTNYIINKALKELAQAKAFIIDLRFNGGGKDGVAMNLLNHLTGEPLIIGTKQAWSGDQSTLLQNLKINPASERFKGPVYLLTSHRTASAAELAVLGTLAIPNIVSIGSNTEGIFSSTLDKTLPNGWTYTLSNEIYLDTNGNNYEDIGIPPDHQLGYSKDKDEFFVALENQVSAGKDEAIEKALKLIEENQ